MRGINVTDGGDLRLSNIRIEVGPDGAQSAPSPTVHLRTDMWPYWLAESIEGAKESASHAEGIPPALEAGDDESIRQLMIRDLRASMRAISAAAFAVDAFYASVKARSPRHPSEAAWREKRTARHAQVHETLRYHLKIDNTSAREVQHRIKQLFQFRDWAVHPGSSFKEPIFRADVDALVDWHYSAFRSENAVASTAMTVDMIDRLIPRLANGSEELAGWESRARAAMDVALVGYEAAGLPPLSSL